MTSNVFCRICASTRLSRIRKRSGLFTCAECDPCIPTRIEKIVVPMLLAKIEHPPSGLDEAVGGQTCGEGIRRPDMVWIWKDRIISIEIDERGGHPDREPSCEIDKMQGQASSWYKLLGGTVVPVFYIRFNPDVGRERLLHKVGSACRYSGRACELVATNIARRGRSYATTCVVLLLPPKVPEAPRSDNGAGSLFRGA
jgi:hypothetical protein